MSLRMTGRVQLALLVLLMFVTWSAPAVHAQDDSFQYHFVSENGSSVLSDVRPSFVDAGHGDYVIMVTFIPTQAEMDALLQAGSHVDFKITLHGLTWSGERRDFAVAPSNYVRHIGAVLDEESEGPVLRVIGLNIEKRWRAGEAITVTAAVFGLQPSSEFWPRVSVEVASSTWSFVNDSPQYNLVYERERNGVTEVFYGMRGTGSILVDPYGDVRFPFARYQS